MAQIVVTGRQYENKKGLTRLAGLLTIAGVVEGQSCLLVHKGLLSGTRLLGEVSKGLKVKKPAIFAKAAIVTNGCKIGAKHGFLF
jgi:hypothetical protein